MLVVDDAPSNIHAVNEILRSSYRVRVATSGAKALELAGGKPEPDLILLDVVMPEMDGYEVCRRLKAAPATKDIPVIFLTGQTEIADETKGFECGAVDYIHKPFSPAVVAARVQTHLALREARQRLARQLSDIRTEMETARKIQISILPRELPRVVNLEIAARYIPMSSVAGDFYDFLPMDEHRVGILVADVSRPRDAGGPDRVDAEDRVRGAGGSRVRPGTRADGAQPGAIREVSGPLRHRGVRVHRHGEADDGLRRGRASAAAVPGPDGWDDARDPGERRVSRLLSGREVLGRRDAVSRGRPDRAVHRRRLRADEPDRGAVRGRAAAGLRPGTRRWAGKLVNRRAAR